MGWECSCSRQRENGRLWLSSTQEFQNYPLKALLKLLVLFYLRLIMTFFLKDINKNGCVIKGYTKGRLEINYKADNGVLDLTYNL